MLGAVACGGTFCLLFFLHAGASAKTISTSSANARRRTRLAPGGDSSGHVRCENGLLHAMSFGRDFIAVFIGSRQQWQNEAEGASLTNFGVKLDRAIMQLQHAIAYRQSDSAA